MDRVGDDASGFSIEADTASASLRVVGWGFWNQDVAKAFGGLVYEACRKQPGCTLLTLDMRELKPMREEGQSSFRRVIKMLKGLGVTEARVMTTSHLTKLQLMRIARESAPEELVRFI